MPDVELFTRACDRVLDCWTALNLAVDNNWGGEDSQQKRACLIRQLIEFCTARKIVHKDEIEDILVVILDESFNVTLEDKSEVEIAEIIVRLHDTLLINNDPSFANDLLNRLQKSNPGSSMEKGYDSEEEDDIELDEDDEPPVEEKRNSNRKYKQTDDGWTTVL